MPVVTWISTRLAEPWEFWPHATRSVYRKMPYARASWLSNFMFGLPQETVSYLRAEPGSPDDNLSIKKQANLTSIR